MKNKKSVYIIGCGVSGLSTAYILQNKGWNVTIISIEDPRKANIKPQFSSLFPAASIIPHSVYADDLRELFLLSKNYFQKLLEWRFPGLKVNEHFELYAHDQSLPGYASLMNHFQLLDDFKSGFYPQHPSIPIQSGWKFECFFADWNLYFPALIDMVLEGGTQLQIKHLKRSDLRQLHHDYIINCSELGAVQLFGDENTLTHRGHILQVLGAPTLLNPDGRTISYNFFPGPDIYQSEYGNPQDVYCYPREDAWILGGSRQEGELDPSDNWIGEKNIEPTSIIDGIEVPSQILNLHSKIIQNTFGINTEQFSNIKSKLGYRYIRKKGRGLRLETEELGDKLIVHNYGHGGAGVTLSWGCALKAARILEESL